MPDLLSGGLFILAGPGLHTRCKPSAAVLSYPCRVLLYMCLVHPLSKDLQEIPTEIYESQILNSPSTPVLQALSASQTLEWSQYEGNWDLGGPWRPLLSFGKWENEGPGRGRPCARLGRIWDPLTVKVSPYRAMLLTLGCILGSLEEILEVLVSRLHPRPRSQNLESRTQASEVLKSSQWCPCGAKLEKQCFR